MTITTTHQKSSMQQRTQKQLILDYIDTFGEITPAKMGGHLWEDGFFGSETSKRCREMRTAGILESRSEGKFEVFYRPEPVRQSLFQFQSINQIMQ